jgi:hypothetical protein
VNYLAYREAPVWYRTPSQADFRCDAVDAYEFPRVGQ